MGSRFQFQIPTEAEARNILTMGVHQAEFHADKLRAQRRLLPVTSLEERRRNYEFVHGKPMPEETPAPTSAADRTSSVDELRARIKPSGPWFTVPAMTRPSQCRSCGADGYWILTESKAKMLVDCDVNGGRRPNVADDGRGVAHFATCPQAKLWSKK